MTDVGVRDARLGDTAAVAEIQVSAWQAAYRGFMPPEPLAEMTASAEPWRARWAEAVTAPPSPRHRVLAAVADGVVVGFAAFAPAEDPDQDADAAEVVTLAVDPTRAREGHGSRLLAAVADQLRELSFTTAVTWVFAEDAALRAFLEPSGWAPDGATRTLALGRPIEMVRLHTSLA
ncbi:GNAT family N-acetyltransferase [Actinocorallia sp. A-T 12471]|uniref:GNAT family N-acetyltransferase n=1 Tax=Actinocorallia sp. A-T 12471 TaxID=3089813 RepID=UPI0029CAF5C0|nr:GNAT family N-acetyltransferase [Actinocorallia sp. A-T 12471]MDX6743426.1 GNAT family N-acetyltransferase [Actinocorallia sp. A-T 12471]